MEVSEERQALNIRYNLENFLTLLQQGRIKRQTIR